LSKAKASLKSSIDFTSLGACVTDRSSSVSPTALLARTQRPHVHRTKTTELPGAGVALRDKMFKKRSARAGGARKTTPKVQAGNTTGAPSLLSFGADEDEGPTFEVKKRKLKQKKKRKEEPMSTPAPQPVTDYSAAGLAALRGSQKALPAELLEESTRAAEEAAQQEEEPAEDTAARARKARVARASSRAATEELDRAVRVEDFDARHMSEDDASDDGLGGRASAQDFVPVPGRANRGVAARLQDEERRRWLKAGADAGDVDAPAAPGGAMDAALRKAGGLHEDDDELEAHEAEVARRGASTKAVAGAVLPTQAPRRRPTTYQDVYATVQTRADELETERDDAARRGAERALAATQAE